MEWISVKDKLPKKNEWVLVYVEDEYNEKKFHVGFWEGGSFEIGHQPLDYYGSRYCGSVTHWMPLPEQPKD